MERQVSDDWQNDPRLLAAAFEGMAENSVRPVQERLELAMQAIAHLHQALDRIERTEKHVTAPPASASADELLRIAIGTGLIQSGYYDQDPDTGTIDVVQWHPCPECPEPRTGRCGCSGIPYLSQAIWDAADKFGDLTRALAALKS